MKEKEAINAQKTRIINEKRALLTKDVNISEQLWVEAKKKTELNKTAAVHNFA
jgi:hypothetical protein